VVTVADKIQRHQVPARTVAVHGASHRRPDGFHVGA
jgi:hypothetical protein